MKTFENHVQEEKNKCPLILTFCPKQILTTVFWRTAFKDRIGWNVFSGHSFDDIIPGRHGPCCSFVVRRPLTSNDDGDHRVRRCQSKWETGSKKTTQSGARGCGGPDTRLFLDSGSNVVSALIREPFVTPPLPRVCTTLTNTAAVEDPVGLTRLSMSNLLYIIWPHIYFCMHTFLAV